MNELSIAARSEKIQPKRNRSAATTDPPAVRNMWNLAVDVIRGPHARQGTTQ